MLATHGFKHIVRKGVGQAAFYRLYRFFYNLFSVASILPVILMLISFPDHALYTIPAPWVYLTTIVQGLAFFALIAGVMQTGVMEFSGLAQLSPYFQDSKPGLLVTDGLYGLVRHPLYSAGLVFMWFSSELTVNRLVLWITFSVYIIIGAYFEEKKLLKDIGPAYAEYKKNTPMFVPALYKRT
jgi:protein-S-isoprenylcysteine O-methyltransferase Ste14